MKIALRLLVILAGFGLGFGAAAVLTGAAFADRSTPRCPRCGKRHDVHPVAYRPAGGPGEQQLQAWAEDRYVGLWEPQAPGPRWSCNRCWYHWGDRFAPPGRR